MPAPIRRTKHGGFRHHHHLAFGVDLNGVTGRHSGDISRPAATGPRREAERHIQRLEQLSTGESGFDKQEVTVFWNGIMEEHARFVAHLLDPDEFELIDEATRASNAFRNLGEGGIGGAVSALVAEPETVTKALTECPETNAVLSAAESILDFKTKAARDTEAARIKSIIDPRLADHVRREALKFVDELKRAV